MFRAVLTCLCRLFLVSTLTFGILLPKISAVLIEVIPGIEQVVICVGTGMSTISMDAEGTPIEVESESHACAMPLLAQSPEPQTFWRKLARAQITNERHDSKVERPSLHAPPPPAIGPPVA